MALPAARTRHADAPTRHGSRKEDRPGLGRFRRASSAGARGWRAAHVRPCGPGAHVAVGHRSEEHTSELQSPCNLVCRLLLEKKKNQYATARLFEEPQHDRCASLLSTVSRSRSRGTFFKDIPAQPRRNEEGSRGTPF